MMINLWTHPKPLLHRYFFAGCPFLFQHHICNSWNTSIFFAMSWSHKVPGDPGIGGGIPDWLTSTRTEQMMNTRTRSFMFLQCLDTTWTSHLWLFIVVCLYWNWYPYKLILFILYCLITNVPSKRTLWGCPQMMLQLWTVKGNSKEKQKMTRRD